MHTTTVYYLLSTLYQVKCYSENKQLLQENTTACYNNTYVLVYVMKVSVILRLLVQGFCSHNTLEINISPTTT